MNESPAHARSGEGLIYAALSLLGELVSENRTRVLRIFQAYESSVKCWGSYELRIPDFNLYKTNELVHK